MTELMPYTATQRDRLERRLTAERNKVDLLERYSHPWRIIGYYCLLEQICSIYIEDTAQNVSVEYTVPNQDFTEEFNHALGNPNANFPYDN